MVQGSKLDNAAPWSRELSENWTFRRADSDEWLPARERCIVIYGGIGK